MCKQVAGQHLGCALRVSSAVCPVRSLKPISNYFLGEELSSVCTGV